MSDHRATLEAKRQRIAEIKAKRQQMVQERPQTINTIIDSINSQPSPAEPERKEPEASPTKIKSEPVFETFPDIIGIPSKPKPKVEDFSDQVYIKREKQSRQPEKPVLVENSEDENDEMIQIDDPVEDTEQYIRRIVLTNEFGDFIHKTSRLVERALNKKFMEGTQNDFINELLYYKPDSSKGTCIGCLEWSPIYKELLMSSYVPHNNIKEGLGQISLWSLALRSRSEFDLHCNSPVTSATFNRFDHNLVLGGTHCGQIMIWDLRKKREPAMKTAMMTESHSHPVLCLSIVGSQNANNIVSASSDGKVCVWSFSMFNEPTSTLDMKQKVKDIGCTTMAFPDTETNRFLMGAEDGSLIQSHLHGNRTIDNTTEIYEGHFGPITGLDINRLSEHYVSDITNGLVLSSSVDWTVKLWAPKNHNAPILSFDIYDDYVYDVKWNPQHPSKFATVDGEGHLDLWNLNKDVENPEYRLPTGRHILNKVAWANDGQLLATGNSMGQITVYKMQADYTDVRSDDWSKLERTIAFN